MKRNAVCAVLVLLSCALSFGQQPGTLGVGVGLVKVIPAGDSAPLFTRDNAPDYLFSLPALTILSGLGLEVSYRFADPSLFYLRGVLMMQHHYRDVSSIMVVPVAAVLGGGVILDVLPWLAVKADAGVGVAVDAWAAAVNSAAWGAFTGSIQARAGLGLRFGSFLLDIMGEYDNAAGIFQGAGLLLSAGVQLG
jgi:hypothetical protein